MVLVGAWRDPKYAAEHASYVVGGAACKPSQLKMRTMNFSQAWRTPGVVVVRYAITLPRAFVIDGVGGVLPEWVDDSLQHPDPDCALESALQSAGWPDAASIFRADDALADAVLEYFGKELLGAWFADADVTEEPGYVINTIDDSRFREGVASFAGEARRTGIAVRYQDAE